MPLRYAFDLEADALLDDVTTIHCLAAVNLDDRSEVLVAHDQASVVGLCRYLATCDLLVGHNVIGYDIPAIEKVLGIEIDQSIVRDTLMVARLVHPNVGRDDADRARIPTRLRGSHSLEAWGHRLGTHKTEYNGGWETYNDTMMSYCVDDVLATVALWDHVIRKAPTPLSMEIEHKTAWIIEQQSRNGVLFDEPSAWKLYDVLVAERTAIDESLDDLFPPRTVVARKFVPKRDNKTRGYKAGVEVTVTKTEVFNPGSRQQIASRLIDKYKWKPTELTDTGQVKVDEDVLEGLGYPEAQVLARRMMLAKRIGQLVEGNKSWIKYLGSDGRIHGRLNTNGAVTGRMTHFSPNMSQVPAPRKAFGTEMRSLFCVGLGRKMVGTDASGLELRMLAHYLTPHDGGAYAAQVLEGDIHSHNQKAAGLTSRDNAKTFIYAFLYGAGDAKIGSIVGEGAKAGRALKTRFLDGIPGLKALRDGVLEAARSRKCLRGLDGRTIPIRSPHSALNTLLQSAGALVMKQALIILDRKIKDRGLDAMFVLNSHDEFQVDVVASEAEIVGKLAVTSIREAGVFFKLRIPLDGESKIGNNWAETH